MSIIKHLKMIQTVYLNHGWFVIFFSLIQNKRSYSTKTKSWSFKQKKSSNIVLIVSFLQNFLNFLTNFLAFFHIFLNSLELKSFLFI